MRSALDTLRALADQVREAATRLLREHSSLRKLNLNSGPVLVVSTSGDHQWGPLDPEGQRLQSEALDLFNRFDSLLRALLPTLPEDALEDLESSREAILGVISQDDSTFHRRAAEAVSALDESLKIMLRVVSDRCSPSDEWVFVPDTNALLANPNLEAWRFGDDRSFTIVLVPQVLAELDHHKMNHRNEEVRRKAESLIGRIKEYRRRGSLSAGVTLVGGVSTITAVATEPRVQDALPWLDSASPDDRIIASTIEIMRSRPNASVVLVTADINAQNKAEFAAVPYIGPPSADEAQADSGVA